MEASQILIIEDDIATAELFKATLSLMGYACAISSNSQLALATLANAVPDLILLDIHLGSDITGEDILFQVRSNPRLLSTRVMVITAFPTVATAVDQLADLVLMKPIDIDQLKTLVLRLISYDILPKRFQFQDPITGLFNREFFMTRLDLAFERTRRRSTFIYSVTLIQFKIETEFDVVSESDLTFAFLRGVATRMKDNLRPTDTIARVSSTRFAVLNEDLHASADVHIIQTRLKSILLQPYIYGSKEFNLSFDFSEVVHQKHFSSPLDIFQLAENKLPHTHNNASQSTRF